MRRLGEISAKLEKGKPGRHMDIGSSTGTYISKIAVLSEAGVSKAQAHIAEKIAAIPKVRFERMIETSVPAVKEVGVVQLLLARAASPRGRLHIHNPGQRRGLRLSSARTE